MYKIKEIRGLVEEGDNTAIDRLPQKQTKYLAAIAKALVNLLEKEGTDAKAKRKTGGSTAKPKGKKHRGDSRRPAVVL